MGKIADQEILFLEEIEVLFNFPKKDTGGNMVKGEMGA